MAPRTIIPRTIIHGDLDAFYASVEQLDDPSLRGKPVIVGGRPGDRGVVSAASYEARAFGVFSAMPLRTAARRCPDGIFVPGRPDRYRELSDEVMAIFASFTPLVEPISLDEAFLDVTASTAAFGDGETIGRTIKQRVLDEVGLVVSVGVATNKLCAKVASDLRKPDALVVVPPGEEAAFLAPLPIRRLWGVGPQAQAALADYGVVTIGQLAATPPGTLHRRFGRFGDDLSARARGIDRGRVQVTPRREERRPRAHVRHRLSRRRPPRGHPARPGRIGRQPPAPARARGGIGPAQASVRGVRDPHPPGAAAPTDPRGPGPLRRDAGAASPDARRRAGRPADRAHRHQPVGRAAAHPVRRAGPHGPPDEVDRRGPRPVRRPCDHARAPAARGAAPPIRLRRAAGRAVQRGRRRGLTSRTSVRYHATKPNACSSARAGTVMWEHTQWHSSRYLRPRPASDGTEPRIDRPR